MVVDDVEDFCAAVIGEMPVCDVGLPASERVLFFGEGSVGDRVAEQRQPNSDAPAALTQSALASAKA